VRVLEYAVVDISGYEISRSIFEHSWCIW